MKRISVFAVLCMISAYAAFAEKPSELVATGDHSVWVITNDVKGMFTKETGISLALVPELAIVGKGCEKGINHAVKGDPARDFGLICCELNPDTVGNHGLKTYPFAREPLAVIVNRKNPVSNLSLQQVREIVSGKITNWKQVGGYDEKIALVIKLHCPLHKANWTTVFSSADRFARERVEPKTQPEMAKMTADFRQAISLLEMTSVLESKDPVKILSVDGYLPTQDTMEKGLYPFYGTLAVLTKGDANKKVMDFVEFLRKSPKVNQVMKKYGMVQVS